MEVVEYDFTSNLPNNSSTRKRSTSENLSVALTQVNALFENEKLYLAWLAKLITVMNAFYQQLQLIQPSPQTGSDKPNLDQDILKHFQITIGIRISNPILEMHHFCLESSKDLIQNSIQQLLSIFQPPEQRMSDVNAIPELSYFQLVALHEVYSSGNSSVSFSEIVKQLLSLYHESSAAREDSSTLFLSSHKKDVYHINHFRSGELFPALHRFMDPTLSFILQMSDWL